MDDGAFNLRRDASPAVRAACRAFLCIVLILSTVAGCDGGSSANNPGGNPAGNPGGNPPAPPANALELVLPRDLAKLPADASLEVRFQDLETVSVRVKAPASQPLVLTFPLGIPLKATNNDGAMPLITASAEQVTINAGATRSFAIRTYSTDIAGWGNNRQSDDYAMSPPQPDSAVHRLLAQIEKEREAAAKGKGPSWSSSQIAIWTLTSDIGVDDVKGKTVAINTQMGAAFGAPATIARIYSYRTARTAQALIEKTGQPTDAFRLFKENEAELNNALANYETDDWSRRPRSGSLKFLGDYSDEPRVRQLILDYMTKHEMIQMRADAVEVLAEFGGLREPHDQLVARVMNKDEHRLVRLSALYSLMIQGDARAEPLIALYDSDSTVMSPLRARYFGTIRARTEVVPEPNERMLDYWERAVGWDKLAADRGDLTSWKGAFDQIRAAEDSRLAAELAVLDDADPKKVLQGVYTLPARFKGDLGVFERFITLAAEHENEDVRDAALRSLSKFSKTFDRSAALLDRLKNEKSQKVADTAAYLVQFQPPEQQKPLYFEAIRSEFATVRRTAAGRLSLEEPDTLAVLLKLGAEDASPDVRQHVMDRLIAKKIEGRREIVSANLAISDEGFERMAIQTIYALCNRLPDDEDFALIANVARMHALPKVREAALGRMEMLAKQFDVRDVLLHAVQRDDVTSQHMAVSTAGNIMNKIAPRPEGLVEVLRIGARSEHSLVRDRAMREAQALGIVLEP